jgi:transcriptional regulator with XRE-family HTH domain
LSISAENTLAVEMNLHATPKKNADKSGIRHTRCIKPHRLLDAVIEKMHLTSDAALANMLEVAPRVISGVRNGYRPIGASLLLRIHEATDIPIRELRALMSDDASSTDQGNAGAAANETHESIAYAPTP